jgi:hypothetical protein
MLTNGKIMLKIGLIISLANRARQNLLSCPNLNLSLRETKMRPSWYQLSSRTLGLAKFLSVLLLALKTEMLS